MRVYNVFCGYDTEQNAFAGPGQRTIKVRLSGCNLRCSYCHKRHLINQDTALKDLSPSDLLQAILDFSSNGRLRKVTIDGGEPLIYTGELLELVRLLENADFSSTICTNGSFPLMSNAVRDVNKTRFVVNYKLSSSGMSQLMMTQFLHVFPNFAENDVFNITVDDNEDWRKLKYLLHLSRGHFRSDQIFVTSNNYGKLDLINRIMDDPDFPDEYSITYR